MTKRASHSVAAIRTRQRIVNAAAELFHDRGYTATGLDDILTKARATKGSFYHHFGSKKEIALAVVREIVSVRFARRMIEPVVNAPQPAAAIRGVIRRLRTTVATKDLLTGCPINNLAGELALQDRDIQAALAALFEQWQAMWTEALRDEPRLLRSAGMKNPRQLSLYLVAAIEGGQAMAKAQQSREPLDAVLKHLEQTLSS
ncbi:MAG: TetR/AcrR family transcriptional regulator [Blastocatellia bacterium]|nr:TetR/AcrR family transcriptional regulator [Blastocatellia bacterium]